MSTTSTFLPINLGANPNDGTGDNIRDAFEKVNFNFLHLYEWAFGPVSTLPAGLKYIDLADTPGDYSTGTSKVGNGPIIVTVNDLGNQLANRLLTGIEGITVETAGNGLITIGFEGSAGGGPGGPDISGIVYVTTGGDDANTGRTLDTSVRTIARGLQIANGLGSGVVVSVYPGNYIEDGDLEIGPGNGVVSAGGQYVTNVFASAGNESKNMFLVNSGSYLQGFCFRNQSVNDFDDPTGGFAVAFAPNATIFRSPYVRDISQVSQYFDKQVVEALGPELPVPNPQLLRGGGAILADRSVLNQNSVFPYILAFGATPRSPNGIGYCARNGAGINGISSISIFQRISFYALDGGQITLNNSGTQFGDITFRSKGSMQVVRPATTAVPLIISEDAATAIENNKQTIIDTMWFALVDGGFTAGQPPLYEFYTRRDAGNLLQSLAFDFKDGDQKVTQNFALGFFDYAGQLVFDYSTYGADFQFAFNEIEQALQAYAPFNQVGQEQTMLNGLLNVVRETINPALTQRIVFSSLIESLAHQFNNAGSGVNANALPLNFRRTGSNLPVPFTVLQETGGRVRWSGGDELNNQYFAGGTRINGLTGKFEGRSFNIAVRQIARRIANSRGAL